MPMRTVTLELLRAGPPHNQLLSPLTQYLGICGESGAGVVHLPYEQYKFDRRLAQLRYEAGTEEDAALRLELLGDTGTEIGRVLGQVPGFAACLRHEDDAVVHLRLVLSASELAGLPWELARVPGGTPGVPAEAYLLLQGHAPVCLTRHVRSVPTTRVRWPGRPRLLVVTGDPDELPFREHLDILHRVLDPWLAPAGAGETERPWPPWVTFLVQADVESVRKASARAAEEGKPYTHVHVLAHGYEDETARGTSFGLLLNDAAGDLDVVSGSRLASALLGSGSCPAVVTLASCDSANQGEVKTPGASFAHTLHQAGIPFVVASQFPLSMDGSETLTEELYSGLLWGEHPIALLHRIRTALHSVHVGRSHDWGSLVVYEALPPDLDEQLDEVVYLRTKAALDAALAEFEERVGDKAPDAATLERLAERVETARGRMPGDGPYGLECAGLQAAASKRLAEVEFDLSELAREAGDEDAVERHLGRCHGYLEDALESYRQAMRGYLLPDGETAHRKASLHWLLIQALSLATVLGRELDENHDAYWQTGRLSAELHREHPDREERAWAHGSLTELWLLRLASAKGAGRAEAGERALSHAGEIVRLFPRRDHFPVVSSRRQFDRYARWWGSDALEGYLAGRGVERAGWGGAKGITETAAEIVRLFDEKTILGRPEAGRKGPAGRRDPGPAPDRRFAPPEPTGDGGRREAGAASGSRLGRSRRGTGDGVFAVEMLPADYGDCLWIEYGEAADPTRVLVDCGPTSTWPRLEARIRELPEDRRHFELFVLTHIDADHIGGTIPFFADESLGVSWGDVWFNGWKHLPKGPSERLGARQGEIFSTLVRDRKLPWNDAAGGGPIEVGDDELPVYELPGGLSLTILSPTRERLGRLRRRWQKELEKHGLTPGSKTDYRRFLGGTRTTSTDVDALAASKFKPDSTPPNGSSIAFLAEFEGRRTVFAADAHVPVMIASLEKLLAARGEERLACDLFKVSHHASQGNTSTDLVDLVDCDRFLVSTSGARFHHPDRETVSRIIRHGGERPRLCFNYRSQDTEVWAREDLQERYGYEVLFPEEGEAGLRISL